MNSIMILASMCVLYKFYVHNKERLFAWSSLLLGPSRLKIGSELSQAWVRFVLGPKNTKGPSCLGSELSGYHTISSPCEPDGSGELKIFHNTRKGHHKFCELRFSLKLFFMRDVIAVNTNDMLHGFCFPTVVLLVFINGQR